MERDELDPGRLYGYAVCLVAILTFVLGARQLVWSVLDFRELPYSEAYTQGPSLASLGAYKWDVLSGLEIRDWSGTEEVLLPTDSEFQNMYEQERTHRIVLAHQTHRSRIVVSLAVLSVSVLLFGTHWSWLRRRERAGDFA